MIQSRKLLIIIMLVFTIGIIANVAGDAMLTASRLADGTFTGLLFYALCCVAVSCAVSPVLIRMSGIKGAQMFSYIACLGTLFFSLWSSYGISTEQARRPELHQKRIDMMQADIYATEVANDKILANCAKQATKDCNATLKIEEQKATMLSARAALQNAVNSTPREINEIEKWSNVAILTLLSLMCQVLASTLAGGLLHYIDIFNKIPPKDSQKRSEKPKKRSVTRNDHDSGTILNGDFTGKK